MDSPSADPRNVSLALAFLHDRARMTSGAIANAIGASEGPVSKAVSGTPIDWDPAQRRAIDAVIATQSMLFDGYSPEAAVEWLHADNADLRGRTPAAEMSDPAGTARVLRAAVARISV